MEKTKFGLSIGMMGFIGYVLGGYGSLWVVVLLMVFILTTETNEILRVNVVQATILCLIFVLLNYLLSGYDSIVNVIGWNLFYRLGSILKSVISITQIVVTLAAAFSALSGKVLPLPIVTPMVEEHFGKV